MKQLTPLQSAVLFSLVTLFCVTGPVLAFDVNGFRGGMSLGG